MSAAHSPVPVQDPKLIPVPAPPPPHRAGKRKPFIWLVVLALIGAGVWLVVSRRQQPESPATVVARTVTAVNGTLDRFVRVTGQTAATDFVNITAPMMKGPEASRELVLIKVADPGS